MLRHQKVDRLGEAITRERYCEIIRALGFDPDRTSDIDLAPNGIYVRQHLINDNGNAYMDGDDIAAETVYIPVTSSWWPQN